MVIGYRAVNEITVKKCYPIPIIDDLLDQGAKYFSLLDLHSGSPDLHFSGGCSKDYV